MDTRADTRDSKILTIYFVLIGGLMLWTMWEAILKGSDAAAAALAVLGGGALIIAPFGGRLEGDVAIGVVKMSLRRRISRATQTAKTSELEGVLALLESDDVDIAPVELPSRFADSSLTSPELQFLRQELHLSAIAVRFGAEQRWTAGGQISDQSLPPGSVLLLAGPRKQLEQLISDWS